MNNSKFDPNDELVSIIIPTYNRADLIGDTLDSIVDQTYSNWECIIIDDHSNDDSFSVISKYVELDSRFSYYSRPIERPKGANSCRNYGYKLSQGIYINWFDSDDLMCPTFLEKQLNSLSLGADVSVCKLEYFDAESGCWDKINNIYSENLIQDYLIGKVQFYVSPPMWTKKFLANQIELFDETIRNLDDWDFNLRMIYQKPKITYLDEVLIKYRVHSRSLSQQIKKLDIDEVKSEFRARHKHSQIIKNNNLIDLSIVQVYIKDRYKYLFREAMVRRDEHNLYYLKGLLFSQLYLFDFLGVFKTLFAFLVFRIFNKGYKLL
ncbi:MULTISPECIES: glycosyltransferase family 2 protein [unclassified Flavobacterium]|uniref:glycosyltransferase family 2 protein n=1 Tax=unclassified Flavobacterium TaxID=196869 RepID=UPI003F91B6A1